ncbi:MULTISPECIES: hypothetical protein [unclassified Lactobacillus]|jgi:hypothetical protein|nr:MULTISPECIES: hypothetical protein [unclassified Lactobacillus]
MKNATKKIQFYLLKNADLIEIRGGKHSETNLLNKYIHKYMGFFRSLKD